MPDIKRVLSPIYIEGWGMHQGPAFANVWWTMLPFWRLCERVWPKPLNFWFTIHSPGINKPIEWLGSQGSEIIAGFNQEMRVAIQDPTNQLDTKPVFVDFFNMTTGARSYDGTHYSLQVNLEKVQVWLNIP